MCTCSLSLGRRRKLCRGQSRVPGEYWLEEVGGASPGAITNGPRSLHNGIFPPSSSFSSGSTVYRCSQIDAGWLFGSSRGSRSRRRCVSLPKPPSTLARSIRLLLRRSMERSPTRTVRKTGWFMELITVAEVPVKRMNYAFHSLTWV